MTSHVPAIGRAIAQGPAARPVLEAVLRRLSAGACSGSRRRSRTSPSSSTRTTGSISSSTTCPRSRSVRRRSTATPTRAGAFPTVQPFRGDPALSWHVIETLIADEFDITTCQEMLVDHALTLPMALMWPGGGDWPVRIVPIAMNHVQHPLPSPKRAMRWASRSAARSRAGPRTCASCDRHRRAVAPARRRARGLHQQAVRPHVHGRAGRRSPIRSRATRRSTSSARLARRAPSSWRGSPRAPR